MRSPRIVGRSHRRCGEGVRGRHRRVPVEHCALRGARRSGLMLSYRLWRFSNTCYVDEYFPLLITPRFRHIFSICSLTVFSMSHRFGAPSNVDDMLLCTVHAPHSKIQPFRTEPCKTTTRGTNYHGKFLSHQWVGLSLCEEGFVSTIDPCQKCMMHLDPQIFFATVRSQQAR